MKKLGVLFLCTGNSCRSQMAEAWTRHLQADVIEPYSAGIEKHGMNPHAVKVMAEAGVDITGQRSKTVAELGPVQFDYVVTVCDQANEHCPLFPGQTKMVHVGFDDPPKLTKHWPDGEDKLAIYRQVRDQIRAFIETLPHALEPSTTCRRAQTPQITSPASRSMPANPEVARDKPEQLFKAFADETRLRLLNLLAQRPHCVCEFQSILRVPQPRISRHLAYLRRSGLVREQRRGKWIIYALAQPTGAVHAALLRCVRGCFQEIGFLKRDTARARCCPPLQICGRRPGLRSSPPPAGCRVREAGRAGPHRLALQQRSTLPAPRTQQRGAPLRGRGC